MIGNRWSALRFTFVLVAFGIAACGSDSKGPPQAGPPTTLAVLSGSGQEGESGEALPNALTVKATDAQGRAVSRAVVTFTVASGGGTLAAAIDTTDAEGIASTLWTMGGLLGAAQVTARITGLLNPAIFTANVKAGPPFAVARVSSLVGSSAAGFDVSDSVAVRVMDRFQHPIAGATVTFAVTAGNGTVSHATRITGADGAARTAWKLGAAGAQTLRASSGAFNVDVTGTAVTCPETQIAVGAVVTMTPAQASCLVTNATGNQRYIVAVTNSTKTSGSAASFRLRGAGGGTVTAATLESNPQSARVAGAANVSPLAVQSQRVHAHSNVLRSNIELIEHLKPAQRAARARVSRNLVQSLPLPKIGDIVPVKIPSFDGLCNLALAKNIHARVVYVGTRGVVLVDTAAASNVAQADAAYRTMGEEFDNVMYPILTTNYGNALAMDSQTDQNDRVFMVFTKHLNEMAGIAGFVSSGDFFPSTLCPSSNMGEYFYARVPTEAGTGFNNNGLITADEWLRETRRVVIHEVKHIVSFAEKLASPEILPADYFDRDQWLEEGSAMLAEELWARTIFGYAQKGNTTFAKSILCEASPISAECQGKPLGVLDHFYFLYQYLDNPENTSAIGATAAGESTFYGSGWMFLRWVIDTYAQSESGFLKAMNLDMVSPGTDNMEARTAKSFADLLSEFAMAIALDDLPGFAPADPKYSLPSWQTREMYSSLKTVYAPNFFQNVVPKKRTTGFGKFAVNVASVSGGGFSIFEIAGGTTDKQLLEFGGASGSAFPAEMRVRIARIQ